MRTRRTPGRAGTGGMRLGEFELIDRFFAPLARGLPGALGLKDDAALLDPAPGKRLVVTCDAMVEGVHFLAGDPPRDLGRKVLRANLSDLAAMGARPVAYLLSLALPARIAEDWLADFVAGLAADQEAYGVVLAGGDTVATPGPLTLALTALGEVGGGGGLLRSGAAAGEAVFVTGSVGDAGLGLRLLTGRGAGLDAGLRARAVARYRLPEPPVAFAGRLPGVATAAIDVSDGLVADLGHLCEESAVGAVVETARVPFSQAVREAFAHGDYAAVEALAAGDDYELLFTARPEAEERLRALAAEFGVAVTRIGRLVEGDRVRVIDEAGREIALAKAGYRHF